MPGRTAAEAVSAFLEPLREALKLLDGVTNLSVSPKGGYRRGVTYGWVLNAGAGVRLGRAGIFTASMQFEIIDCDPSTNEYGHPLRVSTRYYNYKLTLPEGGDAWRMHWHPGGVSDVEFAHLHLPPDLRRHLASERMTLEKAIQWCAQHDAPLTCDPDEAANRLMMIEAPHRLHRSWV
jgi:hypothetical protein